MTFPYIEPIQSKILGILKKEYGLIPFFGIELEFYLFPIDIKEDESRFSERIRSFISQISQKTEIKTERGKNQYEWCTTTEYSAFDIQKNLHSIKTLITKCGIDNGLFTDFSPKPLFHDYGSSMQINISLHLEDYDNVYGKDEIENNPILLNSIAGIMHMLKKSIYLIIEDRKSEFDRFVPNYMAPIFINWGKNNRTTTIRIPESQKEKRRIEFRLPSARTDIANVILFLTTAVLYGIKKNLFPPKPVYCNTEVTDYDKKTSPDLILPKNIISSKQVFEFYTIVDSFILQ